MKILVTGANGFVGGNITEFLVKKNCFEVFATDIQQSYVGNSECTYFSCDISSDNSLDVFLNAISKIDMIIHVAACLDQDNQGTKNILVNCLGTQHIINYAKSAGCKKIVYISSIPIIGRPITLPITEEHMVNPLSTYHATKYFGELLLSMPCNSDLNATILRLPSPAGRAIKKTILPIFIDNCKNGKDIILFGKGLRVQNYIDIRDICHSVLLSIQSDVKGIFNIAGEKSYSNFELAQICINVLNSNSKITFNGIEDSQEDFKWEISIDKAKKLLRFYPQYTIQDTIRSMS